MDRVVTADGVAIHPPLTVDADDASEAIDLAHRLLATTDASVWAAEFVKVFQNLQAEHALAQTDDAVDPFALDEGWIIGWFANAIETGRTAGYAARGAAYASADTEWRDRAERLSDALRAAIDHVDEVQKMAEVDAPQTEPRVPVLPMLSGTPWFDALADHARALNGNV